MKVKNYGYLPEAKLTARGKQFVHSFRARLEQRAALAILARKPQKGAEMTLFEPRCLTSPPRMIDVLSAWKGVECILQDVIARFCPDATKCLEIGVDFGYSTVALSNYFASVVGVDTFEGDPHAGQREQNLFEKVRDSVARFPNIHLVKSNYVDYFNSIGVQTQFDFAHVDIVHTYTHTFSCGFLALNVARVVMFHDTRSFPQVMRAVSDLARIRKCDFYEWPECHGVGILVK